MAYPHDNLGEYLHPVRGTDMAKIGPNTTASAQARSKTAGPNGSFPIGDAKHARLAIPMATRSERAGNITPAQAATVKRRAQAALKRVKAPKAGM
jgi:hypothetical protein